VSGSRIGGDWRSKIGFERLRNGSFVTIRTLLGLLGFVYFIAFTSFGMQANGLIGSHGILPLGDYLRAVREATGRADWWDVPTVLWLDSSDAALRAVCTLGLVFSSLAIFGLRPRPALAGCLILWLSLCTAGQDFMSFQWDILLVEAGFLAVFADSSGVRVWLFRWLIFRLMFFSGAVKLLSHDPTWRNWTALSFHYETQPLPTPVAWYMQQLPLAIQKATTLLVLVVELVVPFLFFAPQRVRHVAAWVTIALQVFILITGNYTFFNLLTIVLTLWLFLPARSMGQVTGPSIDRAPAHSRTHRAVSAALVTFIGIVSGLLCLELFSVGLPPGGAEILHFVDPLRLVNSYGLFAVMTTTRPEIIVEGSDNGKTWSAYEFRDKPGDPLRAPPIVAPHQPRLDWQMWFAALGTYQQNRWFESFMARLLQGEPSVLRLLRYNPFPNGPPKYVRARLYLYHFTHFGQPGWWTREEQGPYFPVASLK
jgi:hypothetical protein